MKTGQNKVVKFQNGCYIKWFSVTPFSKISVLTYTTTDDINRAYQFNGGLFTHVLWVIIKVKKMDANFVSHQQEVIEANAARYAYELENGIRT